MTADRSGSLLQLVELNEHLKAVAGGGLQVKLMALNASVLVQRAGEIASGFGVIARELGVFSGELGACLEQLKDFSHRTMAATTRSSVARQRQVILLRAAAQSGGAAGILGGIAERQRAAREALDAEIRGLRRQLGQVMERAFSLGRTGLALTRSAKVEAAHTKVFSGDFGMLARSFESEVQQVVEALGAARTKLGEGP